MKYLQSLPIFILLGILSVSARAQDPLPAFSVRELTKGKVQVSWNNPYESCIQLAVQRSADSSNNFRTIFSSLSPELPSNGFLDNKPLRGMKSYYRIFYVLAGGAYYFSKPLSVEVTMTNPMADLPLPKATGKKRSAKTIIADDANGIISIYLRQTEIFKLTKEEYGQFRDSINHRTKDGLRRINQQAIEWKPAPAGHDRQLIRIYQKNGLLTALTESAYKKYRDSIAAKTEDTLYVIDQTHIQLRPFTKKPDYIAVYRKDSLVLQVPLPLYKKFRDSMAIRTKDTLYAIDNYHLEIHPFTTRYVWQPSYYVFTNNKGYVTIQLPLVKQHRYRIIFYDEDASELFQLKSLKESELILDKTNFVHAGWFSFELFEDDKLKEKNKFFLSKD